MTGGIDFQTMPVPPARQGGPVGPAELTREGARRGQPVSANPAVDGTSFRQVLEERLAGSGRTAGPEGVRFSGHASQRLLAAGIAFGRPEMERLRSAIDRVGERGGRDALVLLGSVAMVVNVPSRTVVTVVPPDRRGEGVFTNIDSAVIA